MVADRAVGDQVERLGCGSDVPDPQRYRPVRASEDELDEPGQAGIDAGVAGGCGCEQAQPDSRRAVDRGEIVGDLDEPRADCWEVILLNPGAECLCPRCEGRQSGRQGRDLGSDGFEDAVQASNGCVTSGTFQAGERGLKSAGSACQFVLRPGLTSSHAAEDACRIHLLIITDK